MLTLDHRAPVGRPERGVAHGEAEGPPSFVGPGGRIQGALEINGELVISGLVKGRIAALRLVIASDGCVEGDIIAREVVIRGQLNGRVFSPNVSIEDGADVSGRVFHTNITVARGARVTGRMPWRPFNYFESLDQLPEERP